MIANAKEGQISYAAERTIQLVTVKSIGMTHLKDDWLVKFSAVIVFLGLSTDLE